MNAWSVVLVFLALGASAACSSEESRVVARAPLDYIEVNSLGEAWVHTEPRTDLEELVSVEPLRTAGLYPGITAEEAETLLGATDFVTTEHSGRDQIFGYHSSGDTLEIVKQHVASEGFEGDRWFLRYRPSNCIERVSPLLLEQLQSLLNPFPSSVAVVGEPIDQEGLIKIEFRNRNSCSQIWWLSDGIGP